MSFEASTIFRRSNFYFLLALIIIGAAAVYGIGEYKVLQAEEAAVVNNGAERLAREKLNAESEVTYQSVVKEQTKRQKEFAQKLVSILPADENYRELTETLDNYFLDRDLPLSPVFQSSLRYGKGAGVEGMPDISSLPFSMNIEATKANFLDFLRFVHESGSLETSTRLMEINSIQFNFPEGGEIIPDTKQKINFTVDMNAYYLTPKVAR